MKYAYDDICMILNLYNHYLQKNFSLENCIEVDDYVFDGLKFHIWKIYPLRLGDMMLTHIRLSNAAVNDLIFSLTRMSLDDTLEMHLETIKSSLIYGNI